MGKTQGIGREYQSCFSNRAVSFCIKEMQMYIFDLGGTEGQVFFGLGIGQMTSQFLDFLWQKTMDVFFYFYFNF